MSKKLTLRLNEELIDFAKRYSSKKGKPVSKVVANFFEAIRSQEKEKQNDLSPIVKSLKGILKGKNIDESDYKRHIEEKYL